MTGRNKATHSKTKTKILLVDDHPLFRQGVADVLERNLDCQVCGEADDVSTAMTAIKKTQPDMAIVDMALGTASGLDLIEKIKAYHPKLLILVLSMHDETLYAERALRAGARGYVMKGQPVQEIITAISQVLGGKIYLSDRMSRDLLEGIASGSRGATHSPLETLSNRELEVFELIGHGHGTREIAELLHLSVKTIETHRRNIKRKLHLSKAVELQQQAFLWVQRLPEEGSATP